MEKKKEIGIRAQTSLSGGSSAIPGDMFFLNLLEPYLNNETFRMLTTPFMVKWNVFSINKFVPASP